ncbi:MAG: GAF domain-containing protein [Flavobacteriales bacterium]|nr:GAF domain-containing protein [Flavobacteriales bacterium]
MNNQELKLSISSIINSSDLYESKLQDICTLLKDKVDHFDWVGFYFKNGDLNELKLSKFAGIPTAHTIIPFGKGICGQVAVSNKTFIVKDIEKQDNYIACNINVKSEIVVPIFVNGENIGQIDIDSNKLDAFTKEDEELLNFVCTKVAEINTPID